MFAFDLRAAIMSVIETALVASGFHDPRAEATGTTNAWGDHTGHTEALAEPNLPMLAVVNPIHANADQIRTHAASRQIPGFLDWAARRDVRTIGGLPTGFSDSPIPLETVAAIRTLYETHGAAFLDLPNHARYPRRDFFDTADHLHETAQIAHSRMIAEALRAIVRPVIAAAELTLHR